MENEHFMLSLITNPLLHNNTLSLEQVTGYDQLNNSTGMDTYHFYLLKGTQVF
jgi:hypothetical protein